MASRSQEGNIVQKPKSNSKPRQSEAFTLFPSLPKELQLRIWGFAAVIGRVIEIGWDENADNRTDHFFYPRTPSPAILRVNKDSREQGLKVYKVMAFRQFHNEGPRELTAPWFRTYIDYELDTMYLPSQHYDAPSWSRVLTLCWLHLLSQHEDASRTLERIAFDHVSGSCVPKLLQLSGLRQITLVYGDGHHNNTQAESRKKVIDLEVRKRNLRQWNELYNKEFAEDAKNIGLVMEYFAGTLGKETSDNFRKKLLGNVKVIMGKALRE